MKPAAPVIMMVMAFLQFWLCAATISANDEMCANHSALQQRLRCLSLGWIKNTIEAFDSACKELKFQLVLCRPSWANPTPYASWRRPAI
jgi:hypothetical protein